tara:strand:+ start:540 stop:1145 length:606 start_codon:yes stop_codon:yes gene_type:complete
MNQLSFDAIYNISAYLTPQEKLVFSTTTKKDIEFNTLTKKAISRKHIISFICANRLNNHWYFSISNKKDYIDAVKEDLNPENFVDSVDHSQYVVFKGDKARLGYIMHLIDMHCTKLFCLNEMHSTLSPYGKQTKSYCEEENFVFANKFYKNGQLHKAYRWPKRHETRILPFTYKNIYNPMCYNHDTMLTRKQALNVRALIY